MVRVNQEEIETILKLCFNKYKQIGVKLDELEETIIKNKTIVTTKPTERELNDLARLLDVLDLVSND